jgi:hypothetical protein
MRTVNAWMVGFAVAGCAVVWARSSRLAVAQPTPRPLATGSISGTLVTVDKPLSGVIMRTDAGQQTAWRLDRSVIEQVARFKKGDRLWVIYRELGGGDRAVTALGFPGSEKVPVYTNATGGTVRLHTGPFVEGACLTSFPRPGVSQSRLPRGASTEDEAPCWCCSSIDKTCDPVNRSYEPGEKVTGRIILSRCFP